MEYIFNFAQTYLMTAKATETCSVINTYNKLVDLLFSLISIVLLYINHFLVTVG
jgi:hypothetical protein